MNVAVIGKNGQLAWELARTTPADINVHFFASADLNIADAVQVTQKLQDFAPQIIINAAAYTAVDKAESDTANAYAVNAQGPENIAIYCAANNCRLIHISTDFVFNGAAGTPYLPTHVTDPLGVYGASKLAGENAVLTQLPNNAAIIRTAWVYSNHGNNFVKTMLRLMAEREQLGVVVDQIGTPTWANALAQATWYLALNKQHNGIYHWTDDGVASWYDFACAIQELAYQKGLLAKQIPVNPIKSSQYPTPAKRPSYSVLDSSALKALPGLQGKHWRTHLSMMLDELKSSGSK